MAMLMEELFEIKEVTKIFGGNWLKRGGGTVALENFSMVLDFAKPSVTALVGESGSGKTTLARLMLRLTPPTHGEVIYNGKNLWKFSRAEQKEFRKYVQVVFQDPFEAFNPFYKVDHLLQMPVRKFALAKSKSAAEDLVKETISKVGLRPEDTLGRYPHQLSGGQRQRVMVARAILMQPKVIVADEPVSMLDASLRATVLENLYNLHKEFGITILYITHDLTTAYELAQSVIVLYKGRVVEAGDVDSVVQNPAHPYTKLLINSIPVPDPDRKWIGQIEERDVYSTDDADRAGCVFANLCEFTSDQCRQSPPPMYKTSETRAAACYLHKDNPVVELSKITAQS